MDLKKILKQYQQQISAISSPTQLEKLRVEILGRNGIINQLFSKISK
ncbi:hypothetical protein DRH14_04375, partial [Candidatus Shapirobacteria bacterium]